MRKTNQQTMTSRLTLRFSCFLTLMICAVVVEMLPMQSRHDQLQRVAPHFEADEYDFAPRFEADEANPWSDGWCYKGWEQYPCNLGFRHGCKKGSFQWWLGCIH